MTKIADTLALLSAMLVSSYSAPANARARVFVASYGNDSNPCTFGSPCKTFQQAVNGVDAGGEVTAIDSAGFGPINITKAVTITSPSGVEAGIVPTAGGDAIDINAGPNDAVVLRGLTLNGSGGAFGILFNSGASLTVENSAIRGFNTDGIKFIPAGMTTKLFLSNSQVSGNGSSGIFVYPSGTANTFVSLNHVETNNNGRWGTYVNGIATIGLGVIQAAISDSVSSGNGDTGYYNNAYGTGQFVFMTIFRSVANFNQKGVVVDGTNATINISRSMVQFNIYADNQVGASGTGNIWSWNDNTNYFSYWSSTHEN
jgi:hypothetical protein